MKKRFLALACAIALLTGCGGGGNLSGGGDTPPSQGHSGSGDAPGAETVSGSRDLTAGISPSGSSTPLEAGSSGTIAAADFAVRLLQSGMTEGESVLFSPLSVLCALGMTANGAKGQTRSQMETVLGATVEELGQFLRAYREALPSDEECRVSLANSIWIRDAGQFVADQDFLQANADWYGADIYGAPFDQSTCDDINAWVDEHTDGMIGSILDRIPEDVVIYLINALAFDGEWAKIYEADQVRNGQFTTEDGQLRDVELMWSSESLYLADEGACGFLKPYAGGAYAFAALLPEAETPVADYVSSLTGERLAAVLAGAQGAQVRAAIPKFEGAYSKELSGVLAAMGMPDAFDSELADLSGMGTSQAGDLSISGAFHKTYISVDERGTRAGAVTAVGIAPTSIPVVERKEVILDRPFVYLLIDMEQRVPLFIGTMMDPGK